MLLFLFHLPSVSILLFHFHPRFSFNIFLLCAARVGKIELTPFSKTSLYLCSKHCLLCVCKLHTQNANTLNACCQEIRQERPLARVSTCRDETQPALRRNAAKNEGGRDGEKRGNAFSQEVRMMRTCLLRGVVLVCL